MKELNNRSERQLDILNSTQQLRTFLLLASLASYVIVAQKFYTGTESWITYIGLGLATLFLASWTVTNYRAFRPITRVLYYVNISLLSYYCLLLLAKYKFGAEQILISIVSVTVAASTISNKRVLLIFTGFFTLASLFLPESNPQHLKYFFTLISFCIAIVSYVQFNQRSTAIELLKVSEKRFQEISDGNYGGILIFKDNTIVDSNSTVKHIFELDKYSDLNIIKVSDLLGPDAYIKVRETVDKLKGEEKKSFEIKINGKFREDFHVEITLRRVTYYNDVSFAMFIKDINNLKKATDLVEQQKEQMIKVSRLSELGELSASIAHEINNPLSIVLGMAEELEYQIEDIGGKQKKNLNFITSKIIKNAKRIQKIVSSLRTISRDSSNDPFELETVKNLVEESIAICNSSLKKSNIQLLIEPVSEDIKVDCRSGQIEQVLVNIINNAKDAISQLDDKWIKIQVKDSVEATRIFITDSGTGIPEDHRERIFEAYYTTKGKGEGTGLGLHISKKILEEHNGNLFIDLNQNHTCFVIELPHMESLQKAMA